MTDEEFYRHALEVLQRELGADGLARFLRLMRSGSGDYTRDRELLLKDARIADILESIQSYRGKETADEQRRDYRTLERRSALKPF